MKGGGWGGGLGAGGGGWVVVVRRVGKKRSARVDIAGGEKVPG